MDRVGCSVVRVPDAPVGAPRSTRTAVLTEEDEVSQSDAGIMKDPAPPRPLALVADDEAEMRRLIAEILGEVGFETLTARDGLELLDLVAKSRPQLIVMDVMMPIMDGYTAVARLRGQTATAGIPVIMLTGCTDPAYGQLSEGMGAAAHVTKPFSPFVLAELAQEMVRRASV
jgi:CheY-like chemotaxis protein